jgi:hypothetical protein
VEQEEDEEEEKEKITILMRDRWVLLAVGYLRRFCSIETIWRRMVGEQ